MAGALGGALKNELMKKAGELAKYISLGKFGAEKTPTEINAKEVKLAGLTVNNIFYLKSVSGGEGLKEGRFYFVTKVTGEEVQFAMKEGDTTHPEEWSTAITAMKIQLIEEIKVKTPVTEERIATAWEAPLKGSILDKEGHAFKVPASTVSLLLYYEVKKVAEGELKAMALVTTPETFGAEGTYTVTESKWDDLATA